ncbi:MAG: hypothetical protein M3384_15785, partial [Acidobacteriota bacterium]|nr:hypothetical protein [Acidobacteriota bacterium]
ICAGLAVGYFINRAASSSNQSQPSPTESTEESSSPNAGQNDVVLDAPAPEAIDAPVPENVEQAAKTRLPAIEKKVEKKETGDEPEPVDDKTENAEKPKPVQQVEEAPRTPAQNAKRTEAAPRRNQAPPRRVESEPVPDIESVFTGRPSERRGERSESRRRDRVAPDDMSEEEWREWRRQRREERRRRQQNRQYFPF